MATIIERNFDFLRRKVRMVKLKDEVKIEQLANFGFVKMNYDYKISVGALDIFCNIETREINGIGFWPVGDRIVLRELEDLKIKHLFNVT